MESNTHTNLPGDAADLTGSSSEAVQWLEQILPRIMRRLMDSENLDMPLLQLPLAQLRLAQALYKENDTGNENGNESDHAPPHSEMEIGDTMSQLSDRLGVRHNALTQAADRLINHGLAERAGDPRDRRIVRLKLTEKGRTWVQARRERRRAHLAALWSQLDASERGRLLDAVQTLDEIGRRLEPDIPAQQMTALAPSIQTVQTVEETLARFVAGADTVMTSSTLSTSSISSTLSTSSISSTLSTSSISSTLSTSLMAMAGAETTVRTTVSSAESPVILSHAISRKEDE